MGQKAAMVVDYDNISPTPHLQAESSWCSNSSYLPIALIIISSGMTLAAHAAEPLPKGYEIHARSLLQKYCIDCHGADKPDGNVRLDEGQGIDQLLADKQLWWRVLKNVRADMMPPASADQPDKEQKQALINWIETAVSGVDPANPDPGPTVMRRLNRTEYRQTIQELMGIDFNAEIVFPPDDTGFGFDNVGDALSISPMLLEKYVQSAAAIVAEAVPTGNLDQAHSARPGARVSFARRPAR